MGIRMVLLLILSFSLSAQENMDRVLTVVGEGKSSITATVADVSIGIEVEGRSAQSARDALSQKQKPVLDALRKMDAEDLKVENISIYPQYDNRTPRSIVGYKGSSRIQFSTEVKDFGAFVDTAIEAGANQLQNVSVRPSDSVVESAREEALKDATKNALREASIVLDALNLEQLDVVRVEVSPEGHGAPLFRSYQMKAEALQVVEEKQEIKANVTLSIAYR